MSETEVEANWTAPLAGVQRELVGAHFLLLNRLLRKSARGAYSTCGLANLVERRIVLTLYRSGEARVSALAAALGNDVAQVSRALTGLRKQNVVARARQRDPCQLTAEGTVFGAELEVVATAREDLLTEGLSRQSMFEFAGLLGHLSRNATAILAEELAAARDGADSEDVEFSAVYEIPSRLQPAIANLATLISRSASAAFKRLADVSNYEWRILVNIASRPGISFMGLVSHVDSDKAQVSRAVDQLEQDGLIVRSKEERNDPARFRLSAKGSGVYQLMKEDAVRRNGILCQGLSPRQNERLHAHLRVLIDNAIAMASPG